MFFCFGRIRFLRYVKEIIIFKDRIEVFLNLGIRSDEPFVAETEKQIYNYPIPSAH